MVKVERTKKERKSEYFDKFITAITTYSNILLVNADNVRSSQLAKIRVSLRGRAEILMGKNTLIRKILNSIVSEHPRVEKLIPYIRGNIGLVFTNEPLGEIRDILVAYKLPAPARVGSIAQCDVTVPAGPTGMPPEKTSFFQALNISTKINRGLIEIISDVHLLTLGEKVNASQAELLCKMNICPFSYGLSIVLVFEDGQVYPASVLDITHQDLLAKFSAGISNVASVSLSIGYPTVASVPHSLLGGFKNVIAVALESDISFETVDKIREILKNPVSFAAESSADKTDSKPAAVEVSEKEESDFDLGGGDLFGGMSD